MIGLGLSITQIAVRQLLGFAPSSLFANGEQGVWYDPSDRNTLFQDSAGTTPVTAVEQPVGLMLDKSKGLVLGGELVTNGTFDTDTAWTKETGWSISGGAAVASGVNSFAAIYQSASVVVGRAYLVTFTVSNYSAGQVYAYAGAAGFGIARSANGTYTQYIFASGTSQIALRGTNGFTGSVDNISVRELPGNHAFQATSTSRPVLSARYNLLTKTEQFDDAAWTKNAATITANAAVAPDGTTTADKLIATSATAFHNIQFPLGTIPNATNCTVSISAKKEEYSRVSVGNGYGTRQAMFDLATGTVASVTADTVANITPEANGFYRCSITFTSTTNNTPQFSVDNGTGGQFAGNGTSGIYIWGADLRVTNDAAGQPAYQRVNTATDYDTTGFKPYLRADGTDDGLQTNSINFTATDKMTVFAGVRKLSDGSVFMELSSLANTNAGSFAAGTGNTWGAVNTYGTLVNGGASTMYTASSATYSPPITNIYTELINFAGASASDKLKMRVNAVDQSLSFTGLAGTGNFGNYPLYIGRRGGTTLPFNGRLYGLIVVGRALTANEITNTENWLNQRTGAF